MIIVFGLSAFITSQSMFVPANMVLKRYLACRTFSKCQQDSQCCHFSHEFGLIFFVELRIFLKLAG